ncbi:DUF4407 domain-containing protein [Nocardia sp. NPDC019219]|uniref:DUF4407 domain-containing protein n=1 Tax=Nocardia sp. NPDC019219 TaxID=3154590 RepID=UPI0033D79006
MTVTSLFTWLGGGNSAITDRHERAGYAVTGAVVLLFGTISGVVAALAAGSAWPWWAASAAGVVIAALTGALARALATARPGGGPDRLGLIARLVVAVLVGGLLAELAAIVLFSGSVDRLLDEKAQRSLDSAPRVVAAQAELDRAKADRAALEQAIGMAQNDIDHALVIARCELNPAPECPRTRITGVPGRGPEAQTANDMLDDARKQLATAQGRVDAADRRIDAGQAALSTARTAAFDDADRGLGARWQAMNDYTVRDALPLRVLTIVAFVALALLPLVLRWWRGETSFDRHNAARTVHDRAEREADAVIAVKQAEVRAEAETLRAERELTAARLAVEADTAIDRERQRTRIIAAIGGIEIGITEPPRRPELPAVAADDRKDSAVPDEATNLPAPAAVHPPVPAVAPAPTAPSGGGLELPLIGTVPFTDTAARFLRPLVPSFVANAIDTATHPLRTARQAFEEVEEITFTLRRTRKVTVDGQTSHPQAVGYQLQPGTPDIAHAQHIASTVVDADYSAPHAPRYSSLPPTGAAGYGLPTGARRDELPGHHRPELPESSRRELPPGR